MSTRRAIDRHAWIPWAWVRDDDRIMTTMEPRLFFIATILRNAILRAARKERT
jgi:hypothetical protein